MLLGAESTCRNRTWKLVSTEPQFSLNGGVLTYLLLAPLSLDLNKRPQGLTE